MCTVGWVNSFSLWNIFSGCTKNKNNSLAFCKAAGCMMKNRHISWVVLGGLEQGPAWKKKRGALGPWGDWRAFSVSVRSRSQKKNKHGRRKRPCPRTELCLLEVNLQSEPGSSNTYLFLKRSETEPSKKAWKLIPAQALFGFCSWHRLLRLISPAPALPAAYGTRDVVTPRWEVLWYPWVKRAAEGRINY